jgi:hypothetical protein
MMPSFRVALIVLTSQLLPKLLAAHMFKAGHRVPKELVQQWTPIAD